MGSVGGGYVSGASCFISPHHPTAITPPSAAALPVAAIPPWSAFQQQQHRPDCADNSADNNSRFRFHPTGCSRNRLDLDRHRNRRRDGASKIYMKLGNEYLDNLSASSDGDAESVSAIAPHSNGNENGGAEKINLNGDNTIGIGAGEDYDDDDYANSVLVPVRSAESDVVSSGGTISLENVGPGGGDNGSNGDCVGESSSSSSAAFDGLLPPNEEPPPPGKGGGAVRSSASSDGVYGDWSFLDPSEKQKSSSKKGSEGGGVEEQAISGGTGTATVESVATASGDKKENKNNNNSNSNNKGGGGFEFLKNLIGGRNANENETLEKTERERKWTMWMASGRKVRQPSSESDDIGAQRVLSESLLSSVDKGDDYVVVAVPAEAADGIGPILSSFPGGKKFQKTVKNVYQDMKGDGGGGGLGRGGSNATAAAPVASVAKTKTKSPTIRIEKKKKKKKPQKAAPMKKNKGSGKGKDKKQQKEIDEKKQRLRLRSQKETYMAKQQRVREPGRVSANDWRHNIHNLPSSTIARDVRNPVACVFAWATAWSVLHRLLTRFVSAAAATTATTTSSAVTMGYAGVATVTLPTRWAGAAAWCARHMCLPTIQHTMMVSAMSFLLVFRTNSAYQRFAEGRKIWNDIVDASRDFSRMLKLYEFAIGASRCRRIKNLLASFPYLLRHRIRPSLMTFYRVNDLNIERDPENSLLIYPDESLRDTDPEAAARAHDEEETGASRRKTRELCWVDKRTLPWKLVPGSALELCARAQNRPLWVCDRMAKEISVVDDIVPRFTNRERMALLAYVDKLSKAIGACERIHQTVVPLNYARHALRSLTVWLWTLPFVLVKDLGLLTGPAVAVLSWILFGVYEIGSRIEDPFQGSLRLSIYCDAIRRDVLADAIARDTAFNLDGEVKPQVDEDEYDAIYEESEIEYKSTKEKKQKNMLDQLDLKSWGL